MSRPLVLAVCTAGLLATPAAAQASRTFELADLGRLVSAANPALSPDGRWIAARSQIHTLALDRVQRAGAAHGGARVAHLSAELSRQRQSGDRVPARHRGAPGPRAGARRHVGHEWKASVAGAPLTDWTDSYNFADGNVTVARTFGGSPWVGDNAKRYLDQSPITYAHRTRAPTLIMSNVQDFRVPVTQSYKLFRALKDNGVTTQFIAYPGALSRGPAPGDERGEAVERYASSGSSGNSCSSGTSSPSRLSPSYSTTLTAFARLRLRTGPGIGIRKQ